jgi:hypothetical protein
MNRCRSCRFPLRFAQRCGGRRVGCCERAKGAADGDVPGRQFWCRRRALAPAIRTEGGRFVPGGGERFGPCPLPQRVGILPVSADQPCRLPGLRALGEQAHEAKLKFRRPAVAAAAQRHWGEDEEGAHGEERSTNMIM